MIVFAGGAIAGATGAFFSDSETSTGNTFTAGALDLKVDSEAHYNGLVCVEDENSATSAGTGTWQVPQGGQPVGPDHYPQPNMPCVGSWEETDLGATTPFFALTDVKPGDFGENTISLHVYDNDAWGRFVISNVQDVDNDCTEPEEESTADTCTQATPKDVTPGSGELAENIIFQAWIDDGLTPGFQNNNDVGEGDNIKQEREQLVILPGTLEEEGETHNIWQALATYRVLLDQNNTCEATDANGNGQTDEDGDNTPEYGVCQGIADDGRLVGSTTYYFGLEWNVPNTVGNEAQTDSLNATLGFEVEQHRNNDTPFDSEED